MNLCPDQCRRNNDRKGVYSQEVIFVICVCI